VDVVVVVAAVAVVVQLQLRFVVSQVGGGGKRFVTTAGLFVGEQSTVAFVLAHGELVEPVAHQRPEAGVGKDVGGKDKTPDGCQGGGVALPDLPRKSPRTSRRSDHREDDQEIQCHQQRRYQQKDLEEGTNGGGGGVGVAVVRAAAALSGRAAVLRDQTAQGQEPKADVSQFLGPPTQIPVVQGP